MANNLIVFWAPKSFGMKHPIGSLNLCQMAASTGPLVSSKVHWCPDRLSRDHITRMRDDSRYAVLKPKVMKLVMDAFDPQVDQFLQNTLGKE